jgi:hypothetical protein
MLILSLHLCLDLVNGSFFLSFLCALLFSPVHAERYKFHIHTEAQAKLLISLWFICKKLVLNELECQESHCQSMMFDH